METSNPTGTGRSPTRRDWLLLAFAAFLIWVVMRAESKIDEVGRRLDATAGQIAEVKDDLETMKEQSNRRPADQW